jgi:AcrR family transcriptional regulator
VVPEGARKRRRPTKQGTVLSEKLIVDTALRLIRQHSAAALTVRRLGLALGADPSALYRYFRNTDDLLLAVADELIGQAWAGWTPTGAWRTDLYDLGLRMHASYLQHPQAAALSTYRVTGRPHEAHAIESILGVLRGAGFEDREAVAVYHGYVDLSLAFAALDAAGLALPPEARAAERNVWDRTYSDLPAATHPNIAEVAPLLRAEMGHSAYARTLELFLDTAEARLAAQR